MSYRVRSLPSSLFHPSNRALPSDCVARVEKLTLLAGLRSLSLQARLHRLRRPHLHRFRLLKCSFQSLRLHSRTLRSLWRARASPSPAPVEGPTLEPAQASNLDSSSIQAAQSKAPEEAPPGTTARTVETAQAEESSPAAKVPTEEVPLPSCAG